GWPSGPVQADLAGCGASVWPPQPRGWVIRRSGMDRETTATLTGWSETETSDPHCTARLEWLLVVLGRQPVLLIPAAEAAPAARAIVGNCVLRQRSKKRPMPHACTLARGALRRAR